MCGIWCCISQGGISDDGTSNHTQNACPVCACVGTLNDVTHKQQEIISRRGPNLTFQRCFKLENSSSSTKGCASFVHLTSHVLWTQGKEAVAQPYVDATDSKFMLFNGDIYSFNGFEEASTAAASCGNDGDISEHDSITNDGLLLFQQLSSCEDAADMCNILGNLQGPFAFILVDRSKKRLWFARDFFGRESLLFNYETDLNMGKVTSWNISSVSVLSNVHEVPTSGLFCLELETKELQLIPYSHTRNSVSELERGFMSAVNLVGITPAANYPNDSRIFVDLHFSSKLKHPEQDEIADKTTLASLLNLATSIDSADDFIKQSVSILDGHVERFLKHLRKSVIRRVSTLPPYCKNCINTQLSSSPPQISCNHAKIGVLFSGGLDSTVLAYLAAESLPSGATLDLINVAFSKDQNFSNVPDRETAIASYKMLKERFEPEGIVVNLVLVNVNKAEVEEYRRSRVRDLISPLKSVLDDSLGNCLWFAARGEGHLHSDPKQNCYISPVRAVLLGSGADELLGGYGRHRSAYEKFGWEGLASEMQLEIDRISIRNLGRDNRIVSDHGICPRMPFLDENVVDYLARECDLWVKCCPVNVGALGARGCGEKLLLRVTAAKLFGDQYLSLALFPKRAMQFGSRIAKLENSKEKGGDSCQRLL